MKIFHLLSVTLALLSVVAVARADDIPLDASRWQLEINSHTRASIEPVVDKNGRTLEAIRLRVGYKQLSEAKDYSPGAVYVKDVAFHDGIIEADLVGPIEPDDRTFVGIAFRIDPSQPTRQELIYFRPFNSGTEREHHTVQYVATDTIYDWPYLRKNFPGVYEGRATIANNVWFHVRLEIAGTTVQVFVNDGKVPVLVVRDMKLPDKPGSVGFWGYPGAFANLKITPRVRQAE